MKAVPPDGDTACGVPQDHFVHDDVKADVIEQASSSVLQATAICRSAHSMVAGTLISNKLVAEALLRRIDIGPDTLDTADEDDLREPDVLQVERPDEGAGDRRARRRGEAKHNGHKNTQALHHDTPGCLSGRPQRLARPE